MSTREELLVAGYQITPRQYDALTADEKAKLKEVRTSLGEPLWKALYTTQSAIAQAISEQKKTPDEIVKAINARLLGISNPEQWLTEAEGGNRDDLGRYLLTGKDTGDSKHAPTDVLAHAPDAHGPIDIDLVKLAMAHCPALGDPRSLESVYQYINDAAAGKVFPPLSPVNMDPVTREVIPGTTGLPGELPATTDAAEAAVRMRKNPPVWPNGTVAALNANAAADLAALKADKKNKDVAPEILEFKANMSGGGYVLDLNDWHGRSWDDFIAEFAGPHGLPSGDGKTRP